MKQFDYVSVNIRYRNNLYTGSDSKTKIRKSLKRNNFCFTVQNLPKSQNFQWVTDPKVNNVTVRNVLVSFTGTSSRGVCISGSNAGYTMFRGSVKSTGYPLHSPVSPSLPLPCVTVCHYVSTGLYLNFPSARHCCLVAASYVTHWQTVGLLCDPTASPAHTAHQHHQVIWSRQTSV